MPGLADISSHVIATVMYSVEFTTIDTYRCMSIRFWRGDSLVRVELHRHQQSDAYPDCYLPAISCLLSFVSSKPNLVSISGCSSLWCSKPMRLPSCMITEFSILFGLKPFPCLTSCIRTLFRPASHTFGRIDMFSQLKYLVVFLRGSPSQPWAPQGPELCKVSPIWISIRSAPCKYHFSHSLYSP